MSKLVRYRVYAGLFGMVADKNETGEYVRYDQFVIDNETWGREQSIAAWASLRMVRDAIQELFGPIASVSSEEAVSCVTHGPELHHEAEALIEALKRVKSHIEGLNKRRD